MLLNPLELEVTDRCELPNKGGWLRTELTPSGKAVKAPNFSVTSSLSTHFKKAIFKTLALGYELELTRSQFVRASLVLEPSQTEPHPRPF